LRTSSDSDGRYQNGLAVLFWFLLLAIARALLFVSGSVSAQQSDWSVALNLSNTSAQSYYPSITSDPAGNVHVAWCEGSVRQSCSGIFYSRFDGVSWTEPIDLFIPVGGRLNAPVLSADAHGWLHLVWEEPGHVYYSRALAWDEPSAQSWSRPVVVAGPWPGVSYPDLAIDSTGLPHVVFSINQGEGGGIYYSYPEDVSNQAWSAPLPVYSSPRTDRMVDQPRVTVDGQGRLHIVWTETDYPETFPPLGIRYARGEPGGETWSLPLEVNGPYSLGGILAVGESEVHLIGAVQIQTGTSSTWFPLMLADLVGRDPFAGGRGYQGWPSMVGDNTGNVHILQVANRQESGAGSANIETLYHQNWQIGRWAQPAALLARLPSSPTHLMDPDVTVRGGNQLYVAVSHMIERPRPAIAGSTISLSCNVRLTPRFKDSSRRRRQRPLRWSSKCPDRYEQWKYAGIFRYLALLFLRTSGRSPRWHRQYLVGSGDGAATEYSDCRCSPDHFPASQPDRLSWNCSLYGFTSECAVYKVPMSKFGVEFKNVSKVYNPQARQASLRDALARALKRGDPGRANEFLALQDASFSVREGEALGLIGLMGPVRQRP
jgi:hypothetical protein